MGPKQRTRRYTRLGDYEPWQRPKKYSEIALPGGWYVGAWAAFEAENEAAKFKTHDAAMAVARRLVKNPRFGGAVVVDVDLNVDPTTGRGSIRETEVESASAVVGAVEP